MENFKKKVAEFKKNPTKKLGKELIDWISSHSRGEFLVFPDYNPMGDLDLILMGNCSECGQLSNGCERCEDLDPGDIHVFSVEDIKEFGGIIEMRLFFVAIEDFIDDCCNANQRLNKALKKIKECIESGTDTPEFAEMTKSVIYLTNGLLPEGQYLILRDGVVSAGDPAGEGAELLNDDSPLSIDLLNSLLEFSRKSLEVWHSWEC